MPKPKYSKFQEQLEMMDKQLTNRIEELALKVVKANDGITGFCMAMGSISFGVDFMETDTSYPDEDFHIESEFDFDEMLEYKWKHEAAIKELRYIIEEYNDMFKLTGGAIRITKNNGKITVDYDW